MLKGIRTKIQNITLKHLQGQHNQKRHGWRYSGLGAIRRGMRAGVSEDFDSQTTTQAERDAYRMRIEQTGAGSGLGWVGKLERGTRPKPVYELVPRPANSAEEAIQMLNTIDKQYAVRLNAIKDEASRLADEERNIENSKEYNDLSEKIADETWSIGSIRTAAIEDVRRIYQERIDALGKAPDKYTYTIDPKTGWRRITGTTPRGVLMTWKRKYNALRKEWTDANNDAWKNATSETLSSLKKERDSMVSSIADKRQKVLDEENKLLKEKRDAFLTVLSVKDPARVTADMGIRDESKLKSAENGLKIFNSFVSSKVASGNIDVSGKGRGRASFGYTKMNFTSGSGEKTFIHEMGHWLEHTNKNVGDAAQNFLARRTAGESSVSLRMATGIPYNSKERAKLDKFLDAYMGKIYSHRATEILSMGPQMFYEDPIKLANSDSDYFSFVFNTVRGE